ncbi:MAG: acylphosphatase [Promethearchaeota archaeon]|nr:MAG: acylphosphatase [Candidatus Lokiarchaeota archaeon]
MKISNIKIKVFGYVQGVFFRYTTRKVARRLGLVGFVKNLPDGTVYIEAEGPLEKLLELLEFSTKGPKHAQVEKVEHEFTTPTNQFKEFDYEF